MTKIWCIVFSDYEGETHYFIAKDIDDAKKVAFEWASMQNAKNGGVFNEIISIRLELETEN